MTRAAGSAKAVETRWRSLWPPALCDARKHRRADGNFNLFFLTSQPERVCNLTDAGGMRLPTRIHRVSCLLLLADDLPQEEQLVREC